MECVLVACRGGGNSEGLWKDIDVEEHARPARCQGAWPAKRGRHGGSSLGAKRYRGVRNSPQALKPTLLLTRPTSPTMGSRGSEGAGRQGHLGTGEPRPACPERKVARRSAARCTQVSLVLVRKLPGFRNTIKDAWGGPGTIPDSYFPGAKPGLSLIWKLRS